MLHNIEQLLLIAVAEWQVFFPIDLAVPVILAMPFIANWYERRHPKSDDTQTQEA